MAQWRDERDPGRAMALLPCRATDPSSFRLASQLSNVLELMLQGSPLPWHVGDAPARSMVGASPCGCPERGAVALAPVTACPRYFFYDPDGMALMVSLF